MKHQLRSLCARVLDILGAHSITTHARNRHHMAVISLHHFRQKLFDRPEMRNEVDCKDALEVRVRRGKDGLVDRLGSVVDEHCWVAVGGTDEFGGLGELA